MAQGLGSHPWGQVVSVSPPMGAGQELSMYHSPAAGAGFGGQVSVMLGLRCMWVDVAGLSESWLQPQHGGGRAEMQRSGW